MKRGEKERNGKGQAGNEVVGKKLQALLRTVFAYINKWSLWNILLKLDNFIRNMLIVYSMIGYGNCISFSMFRIG